MQQIIEAKVAAKKHSYIMNHSFDTWVNPAVNPASRFQKSKLTLQNNSFQPPLAFTNSFQLPAQPSTFNCTPEN